MSDYADARQINKEDEAQFRLSLPTRGVVRLVVPNREVVKVENANDFGALSYQITHPYMAPNSWIRCIPEMGTGVLTQQRGDIAQSEVINYNARAGGDRIDQYNEGRGLYRERSGGEIELMSTGRAYTSWDQYGNIILLGGMIEQHLSQRDLEHTGWAPTFRRKLFRHDPTKLAHEERFGVVKRPDTQKPNTLYQYPQPTTDTYYHEYSRWLNDDEGKELVSLQEGNVLDVSAKVIKQSKTNRALRYLKTVTHKSSGTFTVEVDNELNVAITNSSQAKQTDVNLGSQNVLRLDTKQIKVTTTNTLDFTVGSTVTTKAPKIVLQSADVQCGSSPVLGVAIGTTLQSSVLEPMLQTLSAALNVVSTDPGLVNPATRAALTGASTALAALSGQLNSTVSSQLKVSG